MEIIDQLTEHSKYVFNALDIGERVSMSMHAARLGDIEDLTVMEIPKDVFIQETEKFLASLGRRSTGRKDKNGRIIREGDTVKYLYEDDQIGEYRNDVVKWLDSVSGFYPFVMEICHHVNLRGVEIVEV